MGAYRSQPLVEKTSSDGGGNGVIYGVSEMQGWRVTMEDAWTCLPDLDEKTSMFAVFDGHGGQEVAQYCSKKLSRLIVESDAYKNGDLKQSLDQAFRDIDKSILEQETINELKELAGDDADDEDGDEAAMLSEEAKMPIEELLDRMKQSANAKIFEQLIAANESNKDVDIGGISQLVGLQNKKEFENGITGDEYKCCLQLEEEKPKDNCVASSVIPEDATEETCDNMCQSNSEQDTGVLKEDNNGMESPEENVEKADGKTGINENSNCVEHDASSDRCSPLFSKLKENEVDDSHDADDDDDCSDDVSDEDNDDDDHVDNDSDGDDGDGDGGAFEDEDDQDDDDDDDDCVPDSDEVGKDSGTTAIVALLRGNQLLVANVGDSRCVLCRGKRAFDMSVDHKPEDEDETKRIRKAGGKITSDGRVNGGLNLSRAIGDHNYKVNSQLPQHEQVIIAVPDVKETALTKDDEFMIIACDGIWNIMSSQEAIDFVIEKLEDQSKEGKVCLSKICEQMFDACLAPDTAGDGSGCDNMTCIIVLFNDTLVDSGLSSRKRTDKQTNDEQPPKKQRLEL